MPNNLTDQQSALPRVFQAIDGTELKRIILAEVERAINANSKFKRHLTYPQFSFVFNIIIRAYPMDQPEFRIAGKYERAKPSDADITPEMEAALSKEHEVIPVAGELNVDAPAEGGLAPDEARERAGLPIPTPRHSKIAAGTVVVDQTKSASPHDGASAPPEPLDDPAAIASGSTSPAALKRLQDSRRPDAPKEPINRPGASPRFARSVDLGNAVAPGGARVDTNIREGGGN